MYPLLPPGCWMLSVRAGTSRTARQRLKVSAPTSASTRSPGTTAAVNLTGTPRALSTTSTSPTLSSGAPFAVVSIHGDGRTALRLAAGSTRTSSSLTMFCSGTTPAMLVCTTVAWAPVSSASSRRVPTAPTTGNANVVAPTALICARTIA